MKARTYTLMALLVFNLSLGGCLKKEPPVKPITVTEAQKRLEKKCRDDFDLHVLTHLIDNTLYVYLPTDKPMFDYEAAKDKGESIPEKKDAKFVINFLDGKFDSNAFKFEYDIIDRKKSLKEDFGYSSSYTDSYSKQQNNLFVAISETFLDVKDTPQEKTPEFIVIIVTDIVKGIEARTTLYLQDLKRYMSGDIPYDEYMKRYLADTKGGQSFIGDEVGTHIDYKAINMPEFLAKQMLTRIHFKFQRSDFQPQDDYDTEVMNQITTTIRYYHYEGFTRIFLNNLRLNKQFTYTKNDLPKFGDDKPEVPGKDGGKLVHIIFENGKTRFADEDKTSDAPITNTTTTISP